MNYHLYKNKSISQLLVIYLGENAQYDLIGRKSYDWSHNH